MTRGVRGLRWWIAGLILTNTQFASLTDWFLAAYSLSQALSGKLYDRIGNKRGFAASIIVWSAASMLYAFARLYALARLYAFARLYALARLHAFTRGLVSPNCFRFMPGLGEAGKWPGAAKAIAEWFPVRQRALGMGIFNSGTSIGSVIAPPLIISMQLWFGWRATFVALGACGFAWLAPWLKFYEPPEKHPRITPEEYALVAPEREESKRSRRIGWMELMRYRETWAIVLARFFADPVWWMYHVAAYVPI